jgi:hypothetical protein
MKSLNRYFQNKVDVSRVRMGKQQEIETLINEEAMLFAEYLRNEKQSWIPRIVSLNWILLSVSGPLPSVGYASYINVGGGGGK